MILTDELIIQANSEDNIKIEPFEEKQLQPASYDLRVGPEGVSSSDRQKVDLVEKGFIELAPGDFAIVLTEEIISLDNQHTARFGLRSKWARRGLIATTGPQIDPGFNGRLTVGLTNLATKKLSLSRGEEFLSVEFHRLQTPAKKVYSGPYQGKTTLDGEDIEVVLDREAMSISEITDTLRTLVATVSNMEKGINRTLTWVGAGVGVITLLVAILAVAVAVSRST